MASKCKACGHMDRPEIDRLLVAGTRQRSIGERYGISPRALRRHASAHLATSLAKAKEAHEVTRADDLLGHLRQLGDEVRAVLDAAKAAEKPEPDLILRAVARLEKQIELAAKIAGTIKDGPTINNIAGDVVQLAVLLRETLAPWPAAQIAVADALRGATPAELHVPTGGAQ